MRRPAWLAAANGVIGRPGWVSLQRHQRVVSGARRGAEEFAAVSNADLAARAAELRASAQAPRPASTPTAVPASRRPPSRLAGRADGRPANPSRKAAVEPFRAEALALAVAAAHRALGLRAHDEHLLAASAIFGSTVVEMQTGEGKTLAGALAAAAMVLAGRRVHVLSVNDYLAERDASTLQDFFELLGIGVDWVGQKHTSVQRRLSYSRDVVYVAVSELGFDVLRDRLALSDDDRVGPVFDSAIVDESDSVMIDEAATPLVLAGRSDQRVENAELAARLVEQLHPEHLEIDAERTVVTLTDAGFDVVESRLGGINLYESENIELLTQINLALHASHLVARDVDYLVTAGSVQLVNTARGRVADLQRWPDGLHAAIEAKEGLEASGSGVVLDSLSVQELLSFYSHLSGMSGTAVAVASDVLEFYGVPTGRVERHIENRRIDSEAPVFATQVEAQHALESEVSRLHGQGRPVLIGTQSVAESEDLARRLRALGIAPSVLNAKNDAEEAAVISRAGRVGAVTISTQISGRGVDIVLGAGEEAENAAVVELGGLAVVASGRFSSRRLDAQLRGRAGRQGDPGSSIAFLSLEDELVERNAPPFLKHRITKKGAALDTRARVEIVDSCQNIAEGIQLDRQQSTWNYSRAISRQRAVVLGRRAAFCSGLADVALLRNRVSGNLDRIAREVPDSVIDDALAGILTFHLDSAWQEHLANLTELRDGIHLRALAGDVPFEEFHKLALREFEHFFDSVQDASVQTIENLRTGDIGRPLDELGLRRPATTWTYMVSDNPLGTPHDRLRRRAASKLRSWRGLE